MLRLKFYMSKVMKTWQGIQVIAGIFPKGWECMGLGTIVLPKTPKQGSSCKICINLKEELLSIELAD
ncbi:hypothetical protein LQT11_20970 [Escherichia coli]|nr:hypothetical protein LQT11_20970 [Escherichia coli]